MTKKYQVMYSKRYVKDLKHVAREMRGKKEQEAKKSANDPRPNGYIKLSGYDDLYRIVVWH